MITSDDLSTEIYIYGNGKVKHIKGQSASLPDSVMTVYRWLMQKIKHLKLHPSKDSLTFPTNTEKPLPEIEAIKFIQPAVDDKPSVW